MTARQLAEWQAYDQVEPFGEFRSELRHGQHLSLVANMNRDSKKKPDPYKPLDFMNFIEKPAEKKLTKEEITATFKALFGATNA